MTAPYQHVPPPPRPKVRRWPWLLGIVGAFVAGTIVGGGGDASSSTSAASQSGTTSAASQPGSTSAASQPGSAVVQEYPDQPVGPARDITARDWAQIAKDPDSHAGEHIIVYGYVTQFDSATGTSRFRANVEGDRKQNWFDYDTNTVLDGSTDALAELVKDDIFRAEVQVLGSYSYNTQIGGSTTVPHLRVTSIEVIGSTT